MTPAWSAQPETESTAGGFTSANGSGGFDPYRAWLGIREIRRPLNAYQILGLPTLEPNVETIRAAAGMQRSAIHARRFGAVPEVWEQIREELEDAIAVLLDPDQKAAYDRSLRAEDGGGPVQPIRKMGIAGQPRAGMIECSQCGFQSPPTRKFCAQCGHQLWESCFKCGTLCMAVEKFCGACGADLQGSVEEQARRMEEWIDQAMQLQAEARFDEAIALLSTLTSATHARLAEYSRRAIELIKQLGMERDQRREEAEVLYQEAQRYLADSNPEAALQLLEGVLPALRSEAMQTLLDETTARIEEINRLGQELKEDLLASRTADLLPKVDRLLAIKPDHPLATQLAQRLEKRVLLLAKDKLAACQYEAAQKILEQMPQQTRSEELEALLGQVGEILWMWGDLRTSPLVDDALKAVAQRLVDLSPQDARAAKALEEIQRRTKLADDGPRRAAIPWAAAPEQTPFGCPVEWLTDFHRLQIHENCDPAALVAHPGSYFVACGLALQGLRQARTKINLLPPDRSIAGRVRDLQRMRSLTKAWGLDLGASGLKAVRLGTDKKQLAVSIEACDYIEHRKLLSQALNEDEEKVIIEETVKTFLSRNDLKGCRICLGLPGRTVILRQLSFPAIDTGKLDAAVRYETRRQINIPMEELVWGYDPLDPPDADPEMKRGREVIVAAARRFQLRDRLSRLGTAGLPVDMVQSDAVALYNFLSYDYFGPAETLADSAEAIHDVTAVVDLGGDAMNVLIGSPRTFFFHGSGFGCHNLTKVLVREKQLTAAQAEALYRNPASAESMSKLYANLEPVFEELVKQIEAAFAQFARTHRHGRITRLLGVGGGFQVHGLLRHFQLGR